MYFAPYGARNYISLRQKLSSISLEVNKLQEQNKALKEEIQQIKHDPVYLEKIARKKYNLLKKNEIIFDFSKQQGKDK